MAKSKKRPKANSANGPIGKISKVDLDPRDEHTPKDQKVTFSFDLVDDEHSEFKYHHGEDAGPELLRLLKELSRLTWGQVMAQRVANGPRNHFHDVVELGPEAQKRLHERNLSKIVGDE